MNILGIIPARGGSKGIPKKNIISLCGKPLIEYTFDAVKESKRISRVVVSTDDKDIENVCKKNSIEIMVRPKELATDEATTADVISNVLSVLREKEKYIPDWIMILQATSPLRTAQDIDNTIDMIMQEDIDSVVSVIEVPHNFLPEKLMQYDGRQLSHADEKGANYTSRHNMRKLYARNGAAIYLFKREVFERTHSYYGERCIPYVMNVASSVDIDTYDDLMLAEALLKSKSEK